MGRGGVEQAEPSPLMPFFLLSVVGTFGVVLPWLCRVEETLSHAAGFARFSFVMAIPLIILLAFHLLPSFSNSPSSSSSSSSYEPDSLAMNHHYNHHPYHYGTSSVNPYDQSSPSRSFKWGLFYVFLLLFFLSWTRK